MRKKNKRPEYVIICREFNRAARTDRHRLQPSIGRMSNNGRKPGEKDTETKPSGILDDYECDGQMSIYDFPEWLPDSMNTKGKNE